MSILPNVLATRYASKEMVAIFDPINKIINERKFWITILKLQQKTDLSITDSDIAAYEKVIEKVDLNSINKREIKTRHDVNARIEEFNAIAGVEKIHVGLTSRDVTDNIELIQVKKALELIEQRIVQNLFLLSEKISEHKKTLMVARSHNIAAQVTTLGKRFATCADELLYALTSLKNLISSLPFRGIKGPVGTSQNMIDTIGDDFSQFEMNVSQQYGFKNIWVSIGQVYPRSVDFEVLAKLVQIAAAPSSLTTTIRLMAGSGLVQEGFKEGQVGSSAMPHKMNPRSSERINGMMVLLRGYNTMAAELAGNQWNEGDVSCSIVRRVMIPDSFFTIDGLLLTFSVILQELVANEAKIKNELLENLPLLATSKILAECVKAGMGREKAHTLIMKYSQKNNYDDLFNNLLSDSTFPLSKKELMAISKNLINLSGDAVNQSEFILKKIGNLKHKKSQTHIEKFR